MPSLLDDEKLSEAVKQYPVLYKKSNKNYKDKNIVLNAWKAVAEQCDMENPDDAKKMFANLKKRFSKRRRAAKAPSGSGTASVTDAKENLRELAFLSWLEPYVQLRRTRTNLKTKKKSAIQTVRELASYDPDSDDESENDDSIDSIIANEDNEDQYDDNNKDENDEDYEGYHDDEEEDGVDGDADTGIMGNKDNHSTTGQEADELFNVDINEMKEKRKKSAKTVQKKPKKVSEVTGRAKWHHKEKTMEEVQMDFFKSVGEQIKSDCAPETAPPVAETENDLFGKYIAKQIAKLPEKFQRIARHEVGNTIFHVQSRADNENLHLRMPRLRSPLSDVATPNAGAIPHPQQLQPINYSINDDEAHENRPNSWSRWSQERSESHTVGDIGSAMTSSLNTYSDVGSPEYNVGTS